MPKMKTNRMARKKFRVTAKGKVKRLRANTSHNTGKKPAKRMRQLRHTKVLDKVETKMVRRMLPYAF